MSGLDILVIIMGVVVAGVGIFCFVTEQLGSNKEETTKNDVKKGENK
ncbi:MAG: hypothetical protein K2L07_11040 [Lachnospiraceae bacterium]|nr:hypothetical protein [Lachnospiraceae bacterium]